MRRRPCRMDELVQYWLDICGRHAIPNHVQQQWWDTILSRYNEPQRAYHTMQHLQEMRALMLEIEDRLCDAPAVGFAIFFHDLIYDPAASDNEERSAEEFSNFARACGCVLGPGDTAAPLQKNPLMPTVLAEKILGYILHTKHHMRISAATTSDTDLLYFLDIDLGILGAERERYGEYAKQIRAEYAHVPHDAYCTGRTGVLQMFLHAEQMYKTVFFREKLQAQAQQNLRWEISMLRAASLRSRCLTIGDRPEVAQFERRERVKDVFTQMREDEVEHAIAMNFSLCLGCRDADTDQLIAQVLTTRTAEERYSLDARMHHNMLGGHLLLHSVAVSREFRRQGIGTRLLRELVTAASHKDQEISKISLLCPPALQPFFAVGGFTVVDNEVPVVQGGPAAMQLAGSATTTNNASAASQSSAGDTPTTTATGGTSPPATPSGTNTRVFMPKHTIMVEMCRRINAGGEGRGGSENEGAR